MLWTLSENVFTKLSVMKEQTHPKDVFEVLKFCNLIADIIGFKYITIERIRPGKYHAFTSSLDKIKVLVAVILCSWLFMDLWNTSIEKHSKRSLIFEIIINVNGKVQGNHFGLVVLSTFFLRYKYFEIINNIQWIDQKVWKFYT